MADKKRSMTMMRLGRAMSTIMSVSPRSSSDSLPPGTAENMTLSEPRLVSSPLRASGTAVVSGPAVVGLWASTPEEAFRAAIGSKRLSDIFRFSETLLRLRHDGSSTAAPLSPHVAASGSSSSSAGGGGGGGGSSSSLNASGLSLTSNAVAAMSSSSSSSSSSSLLSSSLSSSSPSPLSSSTLMASSLKDKSMSAILVAYTKRWLSLLRTYRAERDGRPWAVLFHEYLADGLYREHDILRPEVMQPYRALLQAFIEYTKQQQEGELFSSASPSASGGDGSASELEEAEELGVYFAKHRTDPYSALVGLRISNELAQALAEVRDETVERIVSGQHDFPPIFLYNAHDIVRNLMLWAALEDKNRLVLNVHQLVASFRGVTKVPKGDLLVVQLDDGTKVLGRNTGSYHMQASTTPTPTASLTSSPPLDALSTSPTSSLGSSISGDLALDDSSSPSISALLDVWLSVHDETPQRFPLERLFPIPTPIHALMHSSSLEALGRWVHLPEEDYCAALWRTCNDETLTFLADIGADTLVLREAFGSDLPMDYLHPLRVALSKIEPLLQQNPPELMRRVADKASELVTKFEAEYVMRRSNMPLPNIGFLPFRTERFDKVFKYDILAATQASVRQYWGICSSALDSLKLRTRALLDNQDKKQLVDWWLVRIERAVTVFLRQQGFDPTALPHHYMDEAPASFSQVRRNLNVVRSIMDSKHKKVNRQLKSLIRDLQAEIYERIACFSRDIMAFLYAEFGKDIRSLEPSLQELKALYQDQLKSDALVDPKKTQYLDLLRDLEYLEEMHRLENPKYKSQTMHIVPIRGLVMGTFARRELEHRTSLDLWVPTAYAQKYLASTKSPLHTAVKEQNVQEVIRLIEEGIIDVNKQDSHGWAPLHVCVTSNLNSSSIKIIKLLLKANCNLQLQNDEGNTPLHYAVKTKETEGSSFKIVSKLIDKSALATRNVRGETPLHLASWHGNPAVVKLLLQANADPNEQAKNGETAVHFATRANQPAAVEQLLAFDADPLVVSSAGATALQIATTWGYNMVLQHLERAIANMPAKTSVPTKASSTVERINDEMDIYSAIAPDNVLDTCLLAADMGYRSSWTGTRVRYIEDNPLPRMPAKRSVRKQPTPRS